MNKLTKSLIIGAGLASIGVAGVTSVSALTSADPSAGPSLIDQIASKFNLDKTAVKAVFDANRADREEARQLKSSAALKTALTDGKLTQAQYDYIVAAQMDIANLAKSAAPGQLPATTKAAIKAKVDSLRSWMKAQNLDIQNIGLGMRHVIANRHNDADDSVTTPTP